MPNPAKPEPKIFVYYSPVIPLISGNPVTNISLIFLDRFVENFLGNGLLVSQNLFSDTYIARFAVFLRRASLRDALSSRA